MITQEKKKLLKIVYALIAVLTIFAATALHYASDPWGFYYRVSEEEASLRLRYVETAERYLGCAEADGTHQTIIDRYNAHTPLPQGYVVQYTDSWCSTFVSVIAIECGLTDIIPTECSCQRQIGLFQEIERWQEDERIIPLPGDLIFYDWEQTLPGDCTGWSDHVGIVVGTAWPFIKVIEGNKDDSVSYRYLLINDIRIRGFAQPDYLGKTA